MPWQYFELERPAQTVGWRFARVGGSDRSGAKARVTVMHYTLALLSEQA